MRLYHTMLRVKDLDATLEFYTGFLGLEEVRRHELGDEAMTLARSLADGPPFALSITKEMIEKEATYAFDAALEAEAQAQAICMETPEFREGYKAFMEKREPRFSPIED